MENWSEDQTKDFQSLPGIEPGTAAFIFKHTTHMPPPLPECQELRRYQMILLKSLQL